MVADYSNVITVLCEEALKDEAGKIAAYLGVQVSDCIGENSLAINVTENGISLTDGKLSLMGDFSSLSPRLKKSNLSEEMLVRAVQFKGEKQKIKVLDATAGLGEDSFILAAAGFYVTLYEYDPIIAILLKDSHRRALADESTREIAERMNVVDGNSIEAMKQLDESPDVILLDPMFPERQKSGLIKKKFQLLQKLESPCSDEEELLSAAFDAKPRKIVIKRPAKGPFLGTKKPHYSIPGKSVRYDCFVVTGG